MTDALNPGLANTAEARAARARIRGRTRQQLYQDRARGTHAGSLVQRFRDDIHAERRGQQAPRET